MSRARTSTSLSTSVSRRVLALVIAVATIAFGSVAIDSAAPPANAADPVNLSLGKTATASNTSGTMVAANAVDGNSTSRWSSDGSGNNSAWLQVDLGQSYTLSKVVLNWEAAYATGYKIQLSANGSSWTDAFSTTTAAGGVETRTFTGTARYVRMQGVTPKTTWGYSLYEFEVYGLPA